MKRLLDQIIKENDIKNIQASDYKKLAQEIRIELVRNVSHTGGHLASNLGVVELTMALHNLMDFPEDKLVWDVGHQSYTHKILTGRRDVFSTLRSFGGISGFPKISENEADTFDTGHSSTSISVALGMAQARDLMGEDYRVAAVIGDGALTGGMAFEALNNAANLKSNMVIILNDNKMSIAPNVGGMSKYLGKIRLNRKYTDLKLDVEAALEKIPNMGSRITSRIRKSKDSIKRLFIPGMLFEDMGLTYMGPVDGHNMKELQASLETAFQASEPVILHVITKKGKGYHLAEDRPSYFHAMEPFNIKSGKANQKKEGKSYTDIFGEWLLAAGETHPELAAVCAAMPNGTGVDLFGNKYPERFFDVGIAEEHAVTFSAGLAAAGIRPVVALYSTFLQRAYDQVLHDVCISNLPVIFAIDRSGIVGKDGETHQGIYDISFLSSIPNLTILSPMDATELTRSMDFALTMKRPVVVRYPRGYAYEGPDVTRTEMEYGKAEVLVQESEILLIAAGSMCKTAIHVYHQLKEKGHKASIVNLRFIKPFDKDTLLQLAKKHQTIVTLEENVKSGGIGQQIISYLSENMNQKRKYISISLPDQFLEHGTPKELKQKYGLSPEAITERILRGSLR